MEQTNLTKDNDFFFPSIVFQVEDCLFNVSRKPFVDESQVFRDMFELPNAHDTVSDGMDEAHPLRLDGINSDEFRALLRALCTPHHRPLELSKKEWLSVLKLAHMWTFTELREQATKKLESHGIDAICKLQLARKYEISHWVQQAFSDLVEREDTLTDEEVERIGWQDAVKLLRLREKRMAKLVEHFNSGHPRTRWCIRGHPQPLTTTCRSCNQVLMLKEAIDDGCEKFLFEVE